MFDHEAAFINCLFSTYMSDNDDIIMIGRLLWAFHFCVWAKKSVKSLGKKIDYIDKAFSLILKQIFLSCKFVCLFFHAIETEIIHQESFLLIAHNSVLDHKKCSCLTSNSLPASEGQSSSEAKADISSSWKRKTWAILNPEQQLKLLQKK